ncbi:hypothetical protein ABPG77_010573 [Micractinium sp. CCAP 211/92]
MALAQRAGALGRRLLGSLRALEPRNARSYSADLPDNLLPVVAIIGRPNVGKSALFNRLVRRREALVHDTPGGHVTRDYQEGVARLADLRFKVIDTSGLEPFLPGDTIQARATQLTARVLSRSDVALLLIDGRTGALPGDEQLAQWLRKTVVAAPRRSSESSSTSGTSSSSSPTLASSDSSSSSSSSSSSRSSSSLTSASSDSNSSSSADASSSRNSCRVLVAANKCERRGAGGEAAVAAALAESVRLGFGEPVAISAMTGEGMTELYEVLQPLLDPIVEARQAAVRQIEGASGGGGGKAGAETQRGEAGVAAAAAAENGVQRAGRAAGAAREDGGSPFGGGPLRVAIMGLPNVGKSTLTNWLLRDERCLTGPEPGLTRDAIKERIVWEGREVELVDTAGWIRRTRLAAYDESGGAVAEQTVAEARSVMQFVHVVAMLVDAQRALELKEGLTHREVTLANDVVAEGRLLLIVANKLDALAPAQREQALALIRQTVEDSLPDVSGAPVIGMSALTGKGAEKLLPAALTMYEWWNQRIPTARLNRWVEQTAAQYQVGGGKELNRISYISQVKARPPTFVVWVRGSAPLSVTATRFIAGQIRKQFGFSGVPLRIQVRQKQPRRADKARRK